VNTRGWLALALAFALACPADAQEPSVRRKKKKKPVAAETAVETPSTEEAPTELDAAPKPVKKKKKKPAAATPADAAALEAAEDPLATAREPAIPRAMPDEPPAAPAPAPKGVGLQLVVPKNKRVRAVTFYLEDAEEKAEVEDQATAEPNSIMNIGRGRPFEVGFKGEKVLESRRGLEDVAVIFYVFSGVIKLKEFEITPVFFKKGDDLEDTGETPAIWRLEVLAVNRIGDTDGRVLKTLDDQPLKIGEVNSFPFDVDIPAGKKVGVKLSLPLEKKVNKAVFLQLKASKKGKFPANVLTSRGDSEPDVIVQYNPSVRFTFVPRAGDLDTFSNPTESLIAQINRYIEKHGKGEEKVAVPLKVKVEYR
jgi:hypothetical protein